MPRVVDFSNNKYVQKCAQVATKINDFMRLHEPKTLIAANPARKDVQDVINLIRTIEELFNDQPQQYIPGTLKSHLVQLEKLLKPDTGNFSDQALKIDALELAHQLASVTPTQRTLYPRPTPVGNSNQQLRQRQTGAAVIPGFDEFLRQLAIAGPNRLVTPAPTTTHRLERFSLSDDDGDKGCSCPCLMM